MLFKKLTKLANRLDELGHKKEAEVIDNLLKKIVTFLESQEK